MGTGVCPFCGKKVDKFIMFRGDVIGCRYCGIHTKQTNADRIRAMTDEELAGWLNHMQADAYNRGMLEDWIFGYPNNYGNWLDWLKQEADHD